MSTLDAGEEDGLSLVGRAELEGGVGHSSVAAFGAGPFHDGSVRFVLDVRAFVGLFLVLLQIFSLVEDDGVLGLNLGKLVDGDLGTTRHASATTQQSVYGYLEGKK